VFTYAIWRLEAQVLAHMGVKIGTHTTHMIHLTYVATS
jgi:hypothetical protein